MKMWSFLLVLAIALCTVFSVTLITSASSAGESRITNADFSDVVMTVGADETERGITWYSSYNTAGEVQYAKKTGNEFPDEFKTAVARVVAANESGSYSYKATMRSLCANTEYVYRLVVGDTVSAVYEFETKGFGDFNFVYVADPQVGSASSMAVWENTVNRIESDLNPSFIISGGDQIATPTSETEYGYFLVDGLTGIALAPSNGPAHDNSVLLMDHFNLPNLSSTYGVTLASADYSYTYGNTLFVHLNVESASCEEHIAFLEREIASNPECRWQIVVLHYSFFSGSTASTNANIVEIGEKLAGKLCEAGVDLVLSGHDHFYARSELLTGYGTVSNDLVTNNTVTNPTGTLYLCGSTATGLSIDTPVNQNYAVVQNAQNRRNAINITVTDGTLSISAYFLDTEVPELFDSFTINRTDNAGGTVEKYSVTYVTNENSDINGILSDYSTAYYAVGFMPDPPSLVLPAGSIEEGALYEYSWEYYLNGNKVDTFTAGNEYVAKIVKTTKAVSDTLIISRTANNAEGIYTWAEAWDLAAKFPTNCFTFKLNENITFNKYDQLSVVTKVNVTIDLAGYTWDSQGIQYLVNLTTGSTGSVLSVISSREGGKILAQAPIIVSSNHSSIITVNYGSEDAFPIEVKADGSSGYLVHAGGNFKRGSTLNLNITNGSYSVDAGFVFVRNAGAELSAANHYIINIDNATVTTEGNLVVFNQEYKASASSIIAATNSVIKASGAAVSALSSDLWYGGFEFTGTELDGIIFADKTANITGVSFGDGCTLKNCDANFNSDKTAFASEKLSAAEGLFLYLGADGTVSVTDEEKLPDNVLLISKTANHDKSIYTWNEAWSIAMDNPDVAYIFRLNENSNMGGSELLKVIQKCNVTLDLAGYAMKVSENSTYLISFEGGSTGSSFAVISSKEGGSYNGPSIACIGSGGATSISISIGSADSYPISITTFKTPADKIGSSNGALVSTLGNFKGGSTLTLSVENGSYNLEGGIIYVRNYSTNKNNKYCITIDNANITLSDSAVRFHESFRAVEASYITATSSSFTYSDGTISFLAASQWDGSLEFTSCGFVGIEFDATTTASVSGGVFKKGCTFKSFGETFNSSANEFASDKITCEEGYYPVIGESGSVVIVKPVSSIDRYSITLGTDIALNLYATIHSAHEGAFVRFTINGKTVDVAGVYAEGIGYLFVFDGIGPHAMNDVVTAELVLGESVLATLDGISVKGYCDGMLKKTADELNITESKLASLKSLIASLLEYGAAAQEYLGYNTDSLANKEIDKSLLLDFINPNKTASLSTPSIEGVEITGASVWFDSTNSLRIRFTTTDITSTTVKVGGKTYTSESFTNIGESTYTLTCDPILPTNYRDDVVFELYIGETLSHGLTYGISYYVTSMQSSANEKMKNLAKALYNYGVAAADFKS